MAKFQKNILEVGTYQSPDGEVKVTTDRLRHWSKSFARMKESNIGVPVSWDHNDDPAKSTPIQFSSTRRRRRPAAGTVGYLESFDVSDDGQSATIALDIPRTEDADKVKHNLAMVSPVLFESWKDGRGENHKDCITHVDLVQHPVDNSQTEFEPVIACSFRMGLDTGKPVTYRMAEHEESDDEDKPEKSENPEDDSSHEEEADTTDDDRLKRIKEGLFGMDIVLSEDTNTDNFMEHLEQAILTASAMGGDEEMEIGTEGLDATAPQSVGLGNSPFAKFASNQHRAQVNIRLSTLLEQGRCTPAEYKDKIVQLKAIRLSLDTEGNHVPSQLESWIESRESVPEGTFWDSDRRTRMSQLEVMPHPESTGEFTNERADEVADEILGKT